MSKFTEIFVKCIYQQKKLYHLTEKLIDLIFFCHVLQKDDFSVSSDAKYEILSILTGNSSNDDSSFNNNSLSLCGTTARR